MIIFLITLSILLYSLRGIIFLIGSSIERSKNKIIINTIINHTVSVIIPARNEESNIENCIRSVAANSYPINKYEIIVVNDRSTDKTIEILIRLKSEISNLKIVNKTELISDNNLRGKPGAIQSGIDEATNEIIMLTDADCTVGNKWIQTITEYFDNENVGLIASFTNIISSKLFQRIQAVEWIFMHTMAAAGIGLNQPLGCYGNNMSFRKSVFEQLGGYRKINFSVTEDLALIQSTFKTGKKIRYLTHADADIDTLPCFTLSEYFSQHHRWAVGGIGLGWRAAVFVIASAAIWFGIITSLITHNFLMIPVIILSRIIWDYLLIAPSLIKLKKK